jgi:23S rRNA (uridine2552-2'-O)-methyltransferase
MAPNTIGHKQTDHLRIMAVVEAAYYFAREVLKPGGSFVAKVFQGGAQNELLAEMKRDFKTVKHIKPPSSRKESSEQFLVAQGFRG